MEKRNYGVKIKVLDLELLMKKISFMVQDECFENKTMGMALY